MLVHVVYSYVTPGQPSELLAKTLKLCVTPFSRVTFHTHTLLLPHYDYVYPSQISLHKKSVTMLVSGDSRVARDRMEEKMNCTQ